MPVNKAKNYFLGKDGIKRLNCAQSVICAFKEEYGIDEDMIEKFKEFGGGRAPEGVCGAYYAAKFVLEKSKSEKIVELSKNLTDLAGSLKCTEIRANKKLSCLGCVEKASEFLDSK